MAYQNVDKYQTVDRLAPPRVIPRILGEKTLAAIAGAADLSHLLPLSFNTSTNKWNVWTSGGANGTGTVAGFLWADSAYGVVKTDAANDTLVTVMLAGEIEFADIPVPTGETSNNLKTSLRSGPRTLDLTIRGLDQVR